MCFGYGFPLVNTIFWGFLDYALWLAPNLLPG
jgi:hypothetical protein